MQNTADLCFYEHCTQTIFIYKNFYVKSFYNQKSFHFTFLQLCYLLN